MANGRRRPTLPLPRGGSTIGAVELCFRVRDGTGRFLHAMAAVNLWASLAIFSFRVVVGSGLVSGRECSEHRVNACVHMMRASECWMHVVPNTRYSFLGLVMFVVVKFLAG